MPVSCIGNMSRHSTRVGGTAYVSDLGGVLMAIHSYSPSSSRPAIYLPVCSTVCLAVKCRGYHFPDPLFSRTSPKKNTSTACLAFISDFTPSCRCMRSVSLPSRESSESSVPDLPLTISCMAYSASHVLWRRRSTGHHVQTQTTRFRDTSA